MASSSRLRRLLYYPTVVLLSAVAAFLLAEAYLGYRTPGRLALPFHNKLHPYVMFRPHANLAYVTGNTHEMSHHAGRIYHYTNEDGFRVPSAGYSLPKRKPAGQLRIAFLGSSAVELGSTYETTLPGALRSLLRERYPNRDIEVINAAIQSSVSRQSIAHLVFTVVDYDPDIVILHDGVNDIGMPLTYESRPNFPYNFQTMVEAWDAYREEHQRPLWEVLLNRSRVYAGLRARWGDEESATTVNTVALGLNKAPNAVSADEVMRNEDFARNHVAAYLSNWRQLIELSEAFGFGSICVFQPTGGLDRDYAAPLMSRDFGVDKDTALEWIEAISVLNHEADRQIESLRAEYPDGLFLNLRDYLAPAKDYFWDMVHVYDETNAKLAERIYQDVRKLIEGRPEAGDRQPAGRLQAAIAVR